MCLERADWILTAHCSEVFLALLDRSSFRVEYDFITRYTFRSSITLFNIRKWIIRRAMPICVVQFTSNHILLAMRHITMRNSCVRFRWWNCVYIGACWHVNALNFSREFHIHKSWNTVEWSRVEQIPSKRQMQFQRVCARCLHHHHHIHIIMAPPKNSSDILKYM